VFLNIISKFVFNNLLIQDLIDFNILNVQIIIFFKSREIWNGTRIETANKVVILLE